MSGANITIKRTGAFWAIGLGALIVALLTLTVLNRSWWARKITAKWGVNHAYTDPATGLKGVEVIAPDLNEYNALQMMGLYFNGHPSWTRRA